MLYHVSIEADAPAHVAQVIAEIWGGAAMPFPPVGHDSWVAMAGDARSTLVEVYPRGTALHEGPGAADAIGVIGVPRRYGPTHIAIGTERDIDSVLDIAAREGWPAKYCKRDDAFGVIELWVEGCQLIEVLTPEMQREYVDAITIDGWKRIVERLEAVPA